MLFADQAGARSDHLAGHTWGEKGRGRLAQVRLQADEVEALHQAMRTLHRASTSEALREGVAPSRQGGGGGDPPAPLPEGALPPSEEEPREADETEW
ncbi:hypothetical protein D7319_05850 [Streptomyces radicis]|uniref:Uncharacterized protein n=1 Tax=Streptomyces radicis TaxID=1750517 RepID=A0A3A9WFS2_9ACTN|nr:hypothetical protein D7319_05850 [Streptomyces radicis]